LLRYGYVCDHAAAEKNTAGNLNPVPIAISSYQYRYRSYVYCGS